MSSAVYDLEFLKTASQQLEKYLLSDVLYWPLGISHPPCFPPYPRLTIGGILLTQSRASITCETSEEKKQLNKTEDDIKNLRSLWSVYWDKKGQREFNARLTIWSNFLDDYQENPNDQFDRYSYESRHRVQLELLKKDISIQNDLLKLLAALELILKAYFKPGEFIWKKTLMPAFPPESYWFLYGSLAESVENTER
jgi:hypothetical protein